MACLYALVAEVGVRWSEAELCKEFANNTFGYLFQLLL